MKGRGGRPGLPVTNNPYGLCGRKVNIELLSSELRSCVKVEVDVPGSPSLIRPYGLCESNAALNEQHYLWLSFFHAGLSI